MAADPTSLTACEIARGVNDNRWSAETVTRAFLDRCTTLEEDVQAWATLDPEKAILQARQIDQLGQVLPLRGVPVGIKDIFATAEFTTEYGSPIYRDNQERSDAACVALARAAGAVIFGKTTTTEFAASNPAVTRNPCDLTRSPGGSSSGSAAAVAAKMVPIANGTQTAGSIIRPASYCGVVGYKPSFGFTPRAGLKPSADSLDTVGFFAQNVMDAALFAAVSSGRAPADLAIEPSRAPKLALCRSREWSAADATTLDRIEALSDDLRQGGASVDEFFLPDAFDGLVDALWTVLIYETARALSWERLNHQDLCSPKLLEILKRAEALTEDEYAEALALGDRCRRSFDQLLQEAAVDAVLFPAATGEAPQGLDNTGDPVLNGSWTFLHAPCATLPVLAGPSGLPLGLQLVGQRGADQRLLSACRWIEARFPYHRALDPQIDAVC